MTAPHSQVVQVAYENPDATKPLHLPVNIVCNTSDETLEDQIRINSAIPGLRWLQGRDAHDRPAIMVGGGATAAGFLDTIKNRQRFGGKIFAMNAASKWLREYHIEADYQCILDAQEHTYTLVDNEVPVRIIASQAHPKTMKAAKDPLVWHLELGDIERNFPDARVEAGGYCLLAGGASCGNSAMAVAYALGHREFHVFGYDCSYSDGEGHAYEQKINGLMPTVDMEWDGKKYRMSVGMRGQLLAFQVMAGELKQLNCTVEVYGDALLQHMYRTKVEDMTERDKYRTMWNLLEYRKTSPGEDCVEQFLKVVKPDGLIVDLGCGTGRASVLLAEKGYRAILVDFADNCRDQEALNLPFIEWDLNNELPLTAPYGLCTDVLEHVPTAELDTIIKNIMKVARTTYFQISNIDDNFGKVVGTPLHLTVKPKEWWANKFKELGYVTTWQEHDQVSCRLVVTSED